MGFETWLPRWRLQNTNVAATVAVLVLVASLAIVTSDAEPAAGVMARALRLVACLNVARDSGTCPRCAAEQLRSSLAQRALGERGGDRLT